MSSGKVGHLGQGRPTAVDARPDVELVHELGGPDQDALRLIIDRHGGAVYGIARRIVTEPSLAEEVAQDTFVSLWFEPAAFDEMRGSLRGFLSGIARHKALDVVRREETARRPAREYGIATDRDVRSIVSPDAEPADEVERRDVVRGAVACLSGIQREAIVLAYFGGLSYREVALELGIPVGTAKTRLRDGLMRLRNELGVTLPGPRRLASVEDGPGR